MATRRRSKPVPLEVVQNAKEPEASSDLKMLTLGLPQYLLSVGLWQNPLLHEGGEGELGKLESGNGRCRSVSPHLPRSFDHLVGAQQEHLGNGQAERLGGGPERYFHPEFGWLAPTSPAANDLPPHGLVPP